MHLRHYPYQRLYLSRPRGTKIAANFGGCLVFIIWKLLQHGVKVGKMALRKVFEVFEMTIDSI